jgi:hypothetical protein
MKRRITPWLPAAAVACCLPLMLQGQAFLVDIKTVSERHTGIQDSPLGTRLFHDFGFGREPAALGTSIWFVADLAGDGLRLENLGRTTLHASEMFAADDIVLLRDALDGDQPGTQAGVYRRAGAPISLSPGDSVEAVLAAGIYAILWDGPAVEPAEGTRFGILDLGTHAKPDIGNPFWALDNDLLDAGFAIVPEPRLTCCFVTALLAVLAGWSRRRGRG